MILKPVELPPRRCPRLHQGHEERSGHPRRVPILDGHATHVAFKAADLARLYDVLAAVINRAASTGSMTRFGHLPNMRFGLSAFQ